MLFKDLLLTIVNLTINLMRQIEEVQLLVVSKLMLNCLMKLLGKPKEMYILTLLEPSIETGIISQNHSTNLSYLTPTAEWRRRNKFTTFKIFLRRLTGIKVFKIEPWKLPRAFMVQDKVLSTKANSHSKFEIHYRS